MLRQTQRKHDQLEKEAREAVARFQQQKPELIDQITRLGAPLPEPDLCPRCFYGSPNKRVKMHGYVPDNKEKGVDYVTCRECNYSDER